MGINKTDLQGFHRICADTNPVTKVWGVGSELDGVEEEATCSSSQWGACVENSNDETDFATAASAFGSFWTNLPDTELDRAKDRLREVFNDIRVAAC